MITPGFFDDPDIAELSLAARLFFIGLWTQADREGRLIDDTRRLKVRLFPFDDVDTEALATELAEKHLICRYATDDVHLYIEIRSFTKHQRPHPKETKSVIPPCTGDVPESRERVIPSREKYIPSKPDSGVLILDSGVLSLEGSSEAADGSEPDDAVLLTFPVVGKDGPEWRLRQRQVDEWAQLYPGLDVGAECCKALAWLHANPGRRKTSRGMPRMLNGWLTRATDSGRGGRGGGSFERPFTASELEAARTWRRKLGGCGHRGERCSSAEECMARFIRERLRLERAS